MKIIHYSEAEIKAHGGVKETTGRVVIGQADGAKNFCMRVFEIAPGGSSPNHSHGWEHEVFVHAGKGEIDQEGNRVPLTAGSVVWIRPDEAHQLRNTGKDPFIFVCVIPSGVPEI